MSKIAVFSRYFGYAVGGAERSVLELVKELELQGNSILVVMIGNAGGLAGKVGNLAFPDSWEVRSVYLPFSFVRFRFLEYYLNRRAVSSIAESIQDSDILYSYGTLAPALINAYHGKSVYLVRDEYGLGWNRNYYRGGRRLVQGLYHLVEWPLRALWRLELGRAIDKSDLIANSRFIASELLKMAPGKDVQIIHPKIDVPRLIEEYRNAHSPSKTGVVLIGNNVLKGSDIIRRVSREVPESDFYIFDRSVSKEIRSGNVVYMPWQMSSGAIYKFAKLVVVPSRWEEAFARVVLEAQALGIPVIASRKGGIPEALSGDNVLIEDVENIDSWISAIRRFL